MRCRQDQSQIELSLINFNKLKVSISYTKNMEETKEKYNGGEAQAREAFDELCGMYKALEVCTVGLIL